VGRFIEAPKNAAAFQASRRAASVVFLSDYNPQLIQGRSYMIQGDSTASKKLLELAQSLLQRLIGTISPPGAVTRSMKTHRDAGG
jgi:hypothetical protein